MPSHILLYSNYTFWEFARFELAVDIQRQTYPSHGVNSFVSTILKVNAALCKLARMWISASDIPVPRRLNRLKGCITMSLALIERC